MHPASIIRKASKAAVLPLGLASGRGPADLVILLYHRIGDGEREIDIPSSAFERQLASLVGPDRARSLDQVLESNGGGGVVVTFDDGFRDFHDHALPLLVRHRVPALLYLATGLVQDGGPPPTPESLSWSQLEEAVATGLVTVGSHTHSHVSLAQATEDRAEVEMRRSKELIEDRLGIPCRHFAYPWAVGSAPADRVARGLFDTVAWDAWRTNRRGRIDRHRLGRTPVLRNDGRMFFRAKVRGRLDGERHVYRALRKGPWMRSL
jgi:peptidoglycan/xylan/chitin deacetylase (PgdA/CDA1 family)